MMTITKWWLMTMVKRRPWSLSTKERFHDHAKIMMTMTMMTILDDDHIDDHAFKKINKCFFAISAVMITMMMTMMMTIVHVDHFCDQRCKLCAFSLGPWRISAAIRSQHPKARSWPHTVDLVVQAFLRTSKGPFLGSFVQSLPKNWLNMMDKPELIDASWQKDQVSIIIFAFSQGFGRKSFSEISFAQASLQSRGTTPTLQLSWCCLLNKKVKGFFPKNCWIYNFLFG